LGHHNENPDQAPRGVGPVTLTRDQEEGRMRSGASGMNVAASYDALQQGDDRDQQHRPNAELPKACAVEPKMEMTEEELEMQAWNRRVAMLSVYDRYAEISTDEDYWDGRGYN
jgi:hypothetical protein